MFKRLPFQPAKEGTRVTFTFNEQTVIAQQGDTIATALLANNIISFGQRHGVSKSAFCMMGTCYECLVEINGCSRQACMVEATQDMQVMPLTVTDTHAPIHAPQKPEENSQ